MKNLLIMNLMREKIAFYHLSQSFISIIITSKDENVSHDYGLNLRSILKDNFSDIILFGPSPSVIFKQNNIFRHRMLIKLKKNVHSNLIF